MRVAVGLSRDLHLPLAVLACVRRAVRLARGSAHMGAVHLSGQHQVAAASLALSSATWVSAQAHPTEHLRLPEKWVVHHLRDVGRVPRASFQARQLI